MTKQLKLTLYDVPIDGHWTDGCKNILERQGNIVRQEGRNQLLTWRESDLRNVNSKLQYVDAFDLGTAWLRQGRVGVRLSSRRLYFLGHDLSSQIQQKESKILGDSKRPSTDSTALLKRILEVGGLLTAEKALLPCNINNDHSELDALKYTRAFGKNECEFKLAFDQWKGLRDVKAFSVPECFKVVLVLDKSKSGSVANQYVDALQHEWLPELGIENAEEHIKRVSLEKALERITAIERGEGTAPTAELVFLVPISGKPGDPLPEEQRKFLQALDRLCVQYRCFSFENPEAKWSARSQAVSILQGCGGIPFRLKLPIPSQADDCLFFGVDIGHDHRTKRVSRLVVSVTDKYGLHLASVWVRQDLNEAAANGVLGKMLLQARQHTQPLIDRSSMASIVLRDGKIPEKRKGSGAESLNTYISALGPDTTVVEFRKRGNPYIYVDDINKSILAPAGSACSPADSDVRFVCTHDVSKGLANIYKLHIPEGGDGLSVGLDAMANIVTGLCYSPSLGLRPHQPGPIYWADGVGATSEHQYKFAGQRTFCFAG